ncbi:GlsB/YeaQ/YmgE family stress response membrane protein [Kushneria aurantia]|uniref:GlsB/YeaQ/YmgE family stress response membrane protein n=1 Tax=Kushneria aurantia TaxID=504092 RepID=A0ABV6G395_9GAMM|nr:GlsB/YeaQ/YmgE family stress response membrane protein [Kushneria aurantia]
MGIILWLIIGGLAGWIAGKIMRGGGFGILGNIVVGIVGAVLGGAIFSLLGVGTNNIIGSLVVAIIGSVILLWLVSLIKGKGKM